jgi:transposase
MLSGIDVSYKTVERLYSDEEVIMALHNLHVLILIKKGVEKSVDASGDGTGYSLAHDLEALRERC